jgi:phosphoglycolate phosphatase
MPTRPVDSTPETPPYRLAIFDFDGTLADTLPWFVTLLDDLATRFAIPAAAGVDIAAMRDLSAREIVARLEVPAWKLPRIAAHIHRLAASAEIALFPGVPEMLSALDAAGVRLAVVSSNGEVAVRRALGAAAARVETFACGAKLFGKARVFRSLVKRAGVPPPAVVCLGDEIRDGEAAHEAGLAFAAVSWGYNTPEALARVAPEHVFASVSEIAAALAPAMAGGRAGLSRA